jgi:hypothetical protein
MTLFSGTAVPLNRISIVLRHALTVFVYAAHCELGIGTTLLCGKAYGCGRAILSRPIGFSRLLGLRRFLSLSRFLSLCRLLRLCRLLGLGRLLGVRARQLRLDLGIKTSED